MELSPELIQLLMASNSRSAEEEQAQRQMAMADRLRMSQSPQTTQAGRMTVGKNGFGAASDIMKMYMGQQMGQDASGMLSKVGAQRDTARTQYAQALINALRNQQQVGTPAGPTGGEQFNPQYGP